MADYSWRKVVRTDHEWLIPHGAAIAEFGKAYSAAQAEWSRLHDGKAPSSDDWARVYAADDSVIIRFTTSAPEAGGG